VVTTRIATILTIAILGIMIYTAAVLPHAHAGGGIMSLVAHGAQDVYLTNQVKKLQSEENKKQSEVNELKAQVSKLQSEKKCTRAHTRTIASHD